MRSSARCKTIPWGGYVGQTGCQADFRFPWTGSSHGFGDKYAERDEAVQDGYTDLKLDNLTVEVPRHEGLTR